MNDNVHENIDSFILSSEEELIFNPYKDPKSLLGRLSKYLGEHWSERERETGRPTGLQNVAVLKALEFLTPPPSKLPSGEINPLFLEGMAFGAMARPLSPKDPEDLNKLLKMVEELGSDIGKPIFKGIENLQNINSLKILKEYIGKGFASPSSETFLKGIYPGAISRKPVGFREEMPKVIQKISRGGQNIKEAEKEVVNEFIRSGVINPNSPFLTGKGTGPFEVDLTYSAGKFYKITGLPEPKFKFDLNPTEKVFYHGSNKKLSELSDDIIYSIQGNKSFAESYSLGRYGQKTPKVTTLKLKPNTRLATPDDFNKTINDIGLADEYAGRKTRQLTADYVSEADWARDPRIKEALQKQGYDGVDGLYDFGFRGDFEELPVTVIFNAKKSFRIIDDVPAGESVMKADLKVLNSTGLESGTVSSVYFDPPFQIKGRPSPKGATQIKERFTEFESMEDAMSMWRGGMREAARILAPDGTLIVKIQDMKAFQGKVPVSANEAIIKFAEEFGLTWIKQHSITKKMPMLLTPRAQMAEQFRQSITNYLVFSK